LQRPRWALSTAKPTNEHFPLQSISVCKHVKEHFGFGVLPSLPGNAYNLTAVMFPAPFIVNPYFYRFLLSKTRELHSCLGDLENSLGKMFCLTRPLP
jgi:hypothetical protein